MKCVPNSYLKECFILKVSINNKSVIVVSLYQSPSQTSDKFDSLVTHLEKIVVDILMTKLHFTLIIGYFNAKSNN